MDNTDKPPAKRTTKTPSTAAAGKKSMALAPKYKKAPDAPKRFKSAFIIFSAEKHKEIKDDLASQGRSEKTTDIAKLVSEAWREMPPEEKEAWEKKARKDKARYEVEKSMYKGPWKIPANKRSPKDPSAPKRPMSAFLAFSNKRRAALKREHPDATNADLSKMLSKIWKEAPEETRSKYMEEESALRTHYKIEMGKWRKKSAEDKKIERQEREAIAMEEAETRQPHESSPVAPIPVAAIETRQYSRNGSSEQNMNGTLAHQQQQPQPPDMNGGGMMPNGPPGPGMYGNPYGIAGQMGDYGGYGPMPPGPGPHGYPNLMGGGPFGPHQPMMGGPSPQHQFISQLFNQGFKGNPPPQRGGMGMYGQGGPGPGPGMQGGQPGYGYGPMGDVPPHQQRSMMDPSGHPSHMGGGPPGGYGPNIGSSGMGHSMHEMMGPHHGHGYHGHVRDHSSMGGHGMMKKEEHHYSHA